MVLHGFYIGHTLLKGCVQVNKTITAVESTSKGTYVYSDVYKFDDSDSPANTHADIQSTTEVSNSGDPVKVLRSLEDLSPLARERASSSVTLPRTHSMEISRTTRTILSLARTYSTITWMVVARDVPQGCTLIEGRRQD
jgi:hypothetical protein